jgi:hypothetical protein
MSYLRGKKSCNYDDILNVGFKKPLEKSLEDYLSITWGLQVYKNVWFVVLDDDVHSMLLQGFMGWKSLNFSKYKGLSSMSYRREGSAVALLDFLILISKRPIHQEFSRGEGIHHDQAHEHYHLAWNQIEFICSNGVC